LVRAALLPRIRTGEALSQITSYGFGVKQPTAAESSRKRRLTALTSRLGRALSGGAERQDEVRQLLLSTGAYGVSQDTFAGYRVVAGSVAGAAVLWLTVVAGLTPPLAVLLAAYVAFLGWMAPLFWLRARARSRIERIELEMPELIDLLVVTVEAGMGFSGSMQIAAERFSGPLGDELRLAMQEQAMGLPTDQALANMLMRAETDGMRSFVRSIRQGESLGVSIGQIMRNLAEEMRKRRRAAAEERAQKAPIKILFPLVALIFPAIFVVLLVPAILAFVSTMGGVS
jgi:tight adherence protein C